MTTSSTRRPVRAALQGVAVVCMLLAFLVHAYSLLITEVLGPMHFHSDEAVSLQVMAGWQDPRRTQHVMDGAIRPHSHDLLGRHHHDSSDASVTAVGDDGHDGASDEPASFGGAVLAMMVSKPACGTFVLTPAVSAQWECPSADQIDSCDPRRLERPPKV